MKIALYGPEGTGNIIRDVRNNFFLQQGGLNDSDVYLKTQKITPTPVGVTADSDYGFNTIDLDSA